MSAPTRMEFWKIVGTKKIDGVDAKIRVPTFGEWKKYEAGKLVKESMAEAFRDELGKISKALTFKPSLGPKKLSAEKAFYTARRQPRTLQRRAEEVKRKQILEAR